MSWLKSLFGNSKRFPDPEQVLEQAIGIVQQGQTVEGVKLMKHCVDEIQATCGDSSLEYAAALFHYGTLMSVTGDYERGAELCRKAADACPDTKQGKKDRLTYLMNVGQLLSHGGRAKDAIPVLKTSLAERIDFYGKAHAGVAYGEQVLAEAMLAAGQYEEGVEHARVAAEIFAAERHHEFPGTFALQTALASASGQAIENTWQGLADQPEEMVQEIAQHAYRIAVLMSDQLGLTYLEQLSGWCDRYMADAMTMRINTLITWSNLATEREAHDDLAKSAARLGGLIEQLEDPAARIQLLQGMALSYYECGRSPDEIRDLYDRAAREAERSNLPTDAAGVARNWAVFEADCEQLDEAARQYDLAVEFSRQAGDEGQDILGRSLIAKGIFLQHQERHDEARPLLEEGIGLLPATHSDAACGVLHQVALGNGMSCCCKGGDDLNKQSLSLLAKKFFERSGLADLLDSVGFGEKGLEVHLGREPTEEELERLQIAHSVFTNQIKSLGTPQ